MEKEHIRCYKYPWEDIPHWFPNLESVKKGILEKIIEFKSANTYSKNPLKRLKTSLIRIIYSRKISKLEDMVAKELARLREIIERNAGKYNVTISYNITKYGVTICVSNGYVSYRTQAKKKGSDIKQSLISQY